jgi:hypothetical protein
VWKSSSKWKIVEWDVKKIRGWMKKGMEDEERERNNERVKKRETGGGKMGNKKEQSTQLRFF